ncbi:MAG: nitrilase-related carbon-nitrogen hydrolase [Bacteroidia bacterium]
MKLGLIQFQPVLANLDKNIARLEVLIRKAHQAELLVLPELANSVYHFQTKELAWQTSEEIKNSKSIDFLEAMAKKNNQFIVSGFNERVGKDLFNTSVLVGPNGYIGKYQKFIFSKMKKIFSTIAATGLPVFISAVVKQAC